MAHYRIFNISNSQAEEGLFLNKEEAESELRTIKRHSQDKFKVVTVEEAHKLHWREERKLRKLLKANRIVGKPKLQSCKGKADLIIV